jgi:hypothetical protein
VGFDAGAAAAVGAGGGGPAVEKLPELLREMLLTALAPAA